MTDYSDKGNIFPTEVQSTFQNGRRGTNTDLERRRIVSWTGAKVEGDNEVDGSLRSQYGRVRGVEGKAGVYDKHLLLLGRYRLE